MASRSQPFAPCAGIATQKRRCLKPVSNLLADTSPRRVARLAGVLYVLVIAFGMFAELYVGLRLIVPDNAAETAGNIVASESLFRIGFVSGLLHHTFFLLVILVLFKLLRPVSRDLASLMLVLGLASVPIMMANMLNQFAALSVLTDADYAAAFTNEQRHALAMLFLELHSHGYYVAGLFSGLFLLPLGWLTLKSGWFPRPIGILLMLGCFGYLTELVVSFVDPSYEFIIATGIAVAIVAELSLTFWLLFGPLRGEDEPRFNRSPSLRVAGRTAAARGDAPTT